MRNFDLTPLYRASVGVDRMADVMDRALSADIASYPPYNIEKIGDDEYRIELAIAGFKAEEIEVLVQPHELVVSGRKLQPTAPRNFLHRGIASRAFVRRFELASHVAVAEAHFTRGMLTVRLRRDVPPAARQRPIAIATSTVRDPRSVTPSASVGGDQRGPADARRKRQRAA